MLTAAARVSRTAVAMRRALGLLVMSGGLFVACAGGIGAADTGSVWTQVGSMAQVRLHNTATLLDNGQVLVTGGEADPNTMAMSSAELYDPSTHAWHAAASMLEPRVRQSATLLADGRVLLVGSNDQALGATAEVYSPTTNSWASVPNMPAVPNSPTGARYD